MTREEATTILKNTAWLGIDHNLEKVEEAIEVLSDAQPKRKTGEWIIDENAVLPFVSGDCRCSVCGGGGCESYWNYCPHCGSLNGKIEGE